MDSITFEEAAVIWGETYGAERRKTYATDDIRRLNKYILPAIGQMRLNELKRRDIARMHSRVSARAPIEANRCLGLVRSIMNKMTEWEYFDGRNPTDLVEKSPEKPRTKVIFGEDLARIMIALSHVPHSDAFYLMLFSGLRTSEALGAKWEDLRGNVLILRETKNKKDHEVLLPFWLAESLQDRRVEGEALSEYIFTSIKVGREGERLWSLRRHWRKACKMAGIRGFVPHDLRRTFATESARAGATPGQIAGALGHSSPRVTKKHYIHLQVFNARKCFEIAHEALQAQIVNFSGFGENKFFSQRLAA